MHKIHYITLKWKEIKGISSHQVGYLAPGWKTSSTSKLTNWRRMEESLLWKPPWIPKGHLEIKFHLLLIFNPHPFKIHLLLHIIPPKIRCLKTTEKVSFNIASEASYVYNLSWQKFTKSDKEVTFVEFLKTWSLRSNSVTRQVSFKKTKIGGKRQNSNATFWVIFKQCGKSQLFF